VQIDELHTFVSKKRKKVWIIYAYDAETDEIIAVTAGKRSKKQSQRRPATRPL
jgi:IS1 family transposase